MSSLGGSLPEGGGAGGGGGKAVDFSSYGDGAGNAETGTRGQPGTGFDEHGNVKTSFGRWTIGYDPVTGAATQNVTSGYGFPGEGLDALAGGMRPGSDLAEAGLADVSAAAPGHSTAAAEEQTGQARPWTLGPIWGPPEVPWQTGRQMRQMRGGTGASTTPTRRALTGLLHVVPTSCTSPCDWGFWVRLGARGIK